MATQGATVFEIVKKRLAGNPELLGLADTIIETTAMLTVHLSAVRAKIQDGHVRDIDSDMIEVRLLLEQIRNFVDSLSHLKTEDDEILYMLCMRLGIANATKS